MPRLNPFASGRTKLTKLWDSRIDGHVVSMAWSPTGILAAASADGPISLFDAKTGELCHELPGHGFGTACVDFTKCPPSPTDRGITSDGILASAGQDGKVRLWEPFSSVQVAELPAGAAWGERVAWCSTSNILASAAGKKLRLWNHNGEMVREYPDHPSTIADIQWKPNESILATAAYGKLAFWNAALTPGPSPSGRGENAPALTPNPSPTDRGENEPVREFVWNGSMLAVAWSPDCKHIAVGGQDSTVHFWVLATGEDLQMAGYPTKVRELAWDPTSRYLATGGGPTICVWDFSGAGPAGTTPIQLDAHKDHVNCLAYQHKGALLASGGEDGLLALWNPSKQQGAIALAKHDAPVTQVLWSADDQRLAIGTADGTVAMYAI